MSRDDYDRLWRTTWGDLQRIGPVHRHIQEDLLRLTARLGVRTILDVGCGSGENLAALARSGRYELAGTDLSEEALAIARRRTSAARLFPLDIETDTLDDLDERFDLVMSIQVVEHLRDDTAALANMARMSRRYVFISTMAGTMRPSEARIGHVRNYAPGELEAKLEAAGVTVRWSRGWGFPFYSPAYRTIVEWLPSGPPGGTVGRIGPIGRIAAAALYQLYRLNRPGRGDVLSVLGEVAPDPGR